MKKKLFLALLITLLLLLTASTALAVSYSDYTCTSCGNPCKAWYPISYNGLDCHGPVCYSCGIYMKEAVVHCTPADGSATCVLAPSCSVCSYAMNSEYEPDPDAHSMTDWGYCNSTQHYRYCPDCRRAEEYGFHTGAEATCNEKTVCTLCGHTYGEVSNTHVHGEWAPVGGVSGGQVVPFQKEVTISLPMALEGFTLMRADLKDGQETRTEIPCTPENGTLTFTIRTEGLFLLVPAA